MITQIADSATDIAAIAGIAWITLQTAADPTTETLAIAGLAGYRMQRGGKSA